MLGAMARPRIVAGAVQSVLPTCLASVWLPECSWARSHPRGHLPPPSRTMPASPRSTPARVNFASPRRVVWRAARVVRRPAAAVAASARSSSRRRRKLRRLGGDPGGDGGEAGARAGAPGDRPEGDADDDPLDDLLEQPLGEGEGAFAGVVDLVGVRLARGAEGHEVGGEVADMRAQLVGGVDGERYLGGALVPEAADRRVAVDRDDVEGLGGRAPGPRGRAQPVGVGARPDEALRRGRGSSRRAAGSVGGVAAERGGWRAGQHLDAAAGGQSAALVDDGPTDHRPRVGPAVVRHGRVRDPAEAREGRDQVGERMHGLLRGVVVRRGEVGGGAVVAGHRGVRRPASRVSGRTPCGALVAADVRLGRGVVAAAVDRDHHRSRPHISTLAATASRSCRARPRPPRASGPAPRASLRKPASHSCCAAPARRRLGRPRSRAAPGPGGPGRRRDPGGPSSQVPSRR